jgi:UDP:flavonoid glycosyltransferase YjiC (YdhE family)
VVSNGPGYDRLVRILASCSLGGSGHWLPLVPLLDAARESGYEVLVTGPLALRDMVQGAGFAFWGCGEPTESEIAPIREQLATAPREVASVLGNHDLFAQMATTAMLPEATRAFQEWKPDFVLREPCEFASAVLAKRSETPAATVAISQAAAESKSILVASPALEIHEPGLTNFVRSLPYLTRFPESLDPSVFDETIRFSEPVAAVSTMLPDWWNGSRAPLVYVTFGTVFGHMSLAGDVLRVALDAVAELDARVLVTTGTKFDRSSLKHVPTNTHIEAWVDQNDVFVTADLVVCHGGSGTTLGALRAGLPMVVYPMFADQFTNASKMAALGVCEVVTSRDPVAMAESIHHVLTNDSYRTQALAIAGEMRSMLDVRSALNIARRIS